MKPYKETITVGKGVSKLLIHGVLKFVNHCFSFCAWVLLDKYWQRNTVL